MTDQKIKKEVDFLQNVLYVLIEAQKLSLPPSIEDLRNGYSAGVLTALCAVRNLCVGVPLDGSISCVIDKKTIQELIDGLVLSKEFKDLEDA